MEEEISFFDKVLCILLIGFFLIDDIRTVGSNMIATKIILICATGYGIHSIISIIKKNKPKIAIILYSILSLLGMYTLANIAI